MHTLSIIIPVAPGDKSWLDLARDLGALIQQGVLEQAGVREILLVSSDESLPGQLEALGLADTLRHLSGGSSRATSMNLGAQQASGEFLWFVHADSRLQARHLRALADSLQTAPDALHYFDLQFDGSVLMRLNAWGVWLRSHWLKTPFGDQAFCLKRSHFQQIGAYREDVRFGEDHLLVWQALQAGLTLQCTGVALRTSARKYAQNGWLRTTALHLYLWAKQAFPEFVKLLRQRSKGQKT